MKTNKGFTLIELLIVMSIIAILISISLPSFRGMQNEAKKVKVQGDLRTLKIAIESYYKNYTLYPAVTTYQTTLIAARPAIIEDNMYDPFGTNTTVTYTYKLSSATPTVSSYYIVYSVGIDQNAIATVSTAGIVTASTDAIWESNGH
jgi:prepilin-type N-terminal cleavage/methylation domain-containing protein